MIKTKERNGLIVRDFGTMRKRARFFIRVYTLKLPISSFLQTIEKFSVNTFGIAFLLSLKSLNNSYFINFALQNGITEVYYPNRHK